MLAAVEVEDMYPYLRLVGVVIGARFRPGLGLDDEGVLRLRVWPTDIDVYPEVNNGRHLTLMDLGRFDFALRCGLMRLAHSRRYGFVVAGASVRYRHRLPPLRRFTLHTRLLGRDERWFYFQQLARHNGRVCASALIRVALTSRSGLVPTAEVMEGLGAPSWRPELPDWVSAWIVADDQRAEALARDPRTA
jgi:acyl-CoA thioesterase FadM